MKDRKDKATKPPRRKRDQDIEKPRRRSRTGFKSRCNGMSSWIESGK